MGQIEQLGGEIHQRQSRKDCSSRMGCLMGSNRPQVGEARDLALNGIQPFGVTT
jgi:hypothetical protein